jgi:hypothetical protein
MKCARSARRSTKQGLTAVDRGHTAYPAGMRRRQGEDLQLHQQHPRLPRSEHAKVDTAILLDTNGFVAEELRGKPVRRARTASSGRQALGAILNGITRQTVLSPLRRRRHRASRGDADRRTICYAPTKCSKPAALPK